ncbi:MAG: hypothetical protein KatS3mg059_1695 [Thermomicrobiales bacterium]|nr:MAG: hypothetical protein KatS3mg059_1695 [Thermomicrobiales bacterium]
MIRRRPRLCASARSSACARCSTSPGRDPALAADGAGDQRGVLGRRKAWCSWTLLRAVTGHNDPMLALGFVTLPVVLGMLSGLPGGAGIREALMVAVAKVYGADPAAALVAAVTYRLALFAAIPVLYGAVRLWLLANPGEPVPDAIRPLAGDAGEGHA